MKYKKYLFVLILTLFIGCNNAYAENKEKTCYYMSKSDDFKAALTIRYGFDNAFWHSTRSYTEVYVDKNGAKVEHNREKINNWYGNTMFEAKTSKGNFKFEKIYDNYKEANDDPNPSCPKYLVFQDCSVYRIFATDDATLAKNASAAINVEPKCKGYYATYTNSKGQAYTAEDYYGSFSDLEYGGVDEEVTCSSLFGDKNDEDSIAYLINEALKYIRIIVPLLVITLGSLDLAKAVVASKEDEMKKAQSTFVKRLIIGVAVFLVPFLVNVIMDLADIVWEGLGYSSCGY